MAQVAEQAMPRPRRGPVARHSIRRAAFFDVQPIGRPDRVSATRSTDVIGAAPAGDSSSSRSSSNSTNSTAASANNGVGRGACPRTISLPSDVIDAIADAAVGIAVDAAGARGQCAAASRLSHRRLGVAPALSEEAQAVLRSMSQVSRAWRRTLLVRAWRSVHLSGTAHPCVDDIHEFAGICARHLVVPWGAMAAPVSWADSASALADEHIDAEADVDDAGTDCSTEYSVAFSVDSASRIHDKTSSSLDSLTSASTSASRLRGVFGDRAWPAVEHLDMSFMPLICYQGFAAHVRRTMPRLRTLRISGFVPATALAEILDSARLPLTALEIAGSVWANADGGRRSSMSSWHSSATTVATGDSADDADPEDLHGPFTPPTQLALSPKIAAPPPPPPQPLALMAVTADALRSSPVFAFAVAQAPTLSALHLIECDHKIMDMLRTGRLEERHMRAVEWGAAQMVLHSQQTTSRATAGHRRRHPPPVRWSLLRELHIVQFHMSPRENTGLCVHADCMPALRSIVVGSMEPSDHHHPAPTAADALQVPCLRGVFGCLEHISAPALDLHTLPAKAPQLRSLHISGGSSALAPSPADIDALLSSSLPLKHLAVAGHRLRPAQQQ
ncbi:hypothetical protein IW140_006578 [Coemansia sp. RSA 1813]|nr:hypothetical protein IW140_006578 [Coemansia sp. RSA 1813]